MQDLQGNNITILYETDFEDLRHLRILLISTCAAERIELKNHNKCVVRVLTFFPCCRRHLMDNQIHTVERGALSDLLALER
ncbi:hypothetical protein FOCC_FOCC003715, partial [Frankliniella occidentalis]